MDVLPPLFEPATLPFDRQMLVRYLRDRLPGLEGEVLVRQFQGGQSNPTYLIEGERRYVLRKKPAGATLPSAHQIEREYRVMDALAATPVPVPKMELICEDDVVVGTPFYVMEAVDGRVFHDCTIPSASAESRRAMYLGMVEALADLHAVDWQAVGLEGFGRPEAYLERQVARWTRQFEQSGNEPNPVMERLAGWLRANLPAPRPTVIAHGDYRVGNLVFDNDQPRIRAVLDWELATLGDPIADLAYTCLPYHLDSGLAGIPGLRDLDIAALGIPDERTLVGAYCARSGLGEIPHWNYYLAFALFRTAAILQGIYARALQNSSASDDALSVGANAAYVAQAGWACALGETVPEQS
jgi:aminoglycoside phosphotransferase (APT) family kinase protein